MNPTTHPLPEEAAMFKPGDRVIHLTSGRHGYVLSVGSACSCGSDPGAVKIQQDSINLPLDTRAVFLRPEPQLTR